MKLKIFAAVAIGEVIAVAADWTPVQWVTKPLLAPLLIWFLVAHRAPALKAALLFAFLGDVALLVPGRAAFLVGMAFFLGAQAGFIVAFRRRGRPPVAVLTSYLIIWLLINGLLWDRLGALRGPILMYSLALAVMAASAAAVSRRTAIGGALFLLSDLMIGAGAAGIHLPASGVLVMTTYAAALYLIVTGSVQQPSLRTEEYEMSSSVQ